MTPKQINIITNVIGALLVILGAMHTYLTSQPFSWTTFIMCILGAVVAYFTGKSSLSIQKNNPMLKVLMIVALIMAIGTPSYAGDICFWTACQPPKPQLEACPKMATAVLPTPGDILAIFPTATEVDGVGVYLFGAKDIGIGPSYTIAKVWTLVSLDAQFATMSKGSSYVAGAGDITIVDLLTKLGQTPGATSVITLLNPSIGGTFGYRTAIASQGAGWDGGVRFKVLTVDTSKIFGWIGL